MDDRVNSDDARYNPMMSMGGRGGARGVKGAQDGSASVSSQESQSQMSDMYMPQSQHQQMPQHPGKRRNVLPDFVGIDLLLYLLYWQALSLS